MSSPIAPYSLELASAPSTPTQQNYDTGSGMDLLSIELFAYLFSFFSLQDKMRFESICKGWQWLIRIDPCYSLYKEIFIKVIPTPSLSTEIIEEKVVAKNRIPLDDTAYIEVVGTDEKYSLSVKSNTDEPLAEIDINKLLQKSQNSKTFQIAHFRITKGFQSDEHIVFFGEIVLKITGDALNCIILYTKKTGVSLCITSSNRILLDSDKQTKIINFTGSALTNYTKTGENSFITWIFFNEKINNAIILKNCINMDTKNNVFYTTGNRSKSVYSFFKYPSDSNPRSRPIQTYRFPTDNLALFSQVISVENPSKFIVFRNEKRKEGSEVMIVIWEQFSHIDENISTIPSLQEGAGDYFEESWCFDQRSELFNVFYEESFYPYILFQLDDHFFLYRVDTKQTFKKIPCSTAIRRVAIYPHLKIFAIAQETLFTIYANLEAKVSPTFKIGLSSFKNSLSTEALFYYTNAFNCFYQISLKTLQEKEERASQASPFAAQTKHLESE